MDLHRRVRELELLGIGVDGDEIDLCDPGVHHPVDGVDARAADPDDADHGQVGRDVAGDVESRRALRHRRHETACGRRVRLDRRLRNRLGARGPRRGLLLDARRDELDDGREALLAAGLDLGLPAGLAARLWDARLGSTWIGCRYHR